MSEPAGGLRALHPEEVERVLRSCLLTRYIARNQMIVMLNYDAGLTVTEIAALRRCDTMVLEPCGATHGWVPAERITVRGSSARDVPMTKRLQKTISLVTRGVDGYVESPLVMPERQQDSLRHMLPSSVGNRLYTLFLKAGITDVSSRSGRAAFVRDALAARPLVGAKLSTVQTLAGFKEARWLAPYRAADNDAVDGVSWRRRQEMGDVLVASENDRRLAADAAKAAATAALAARQKKPAEQFQLF